MSGRIPDGCAHGLAVEQREVRAAGHAVDPARLRGEEPAKGLRGRHQPAGERVVVEGGRQDPRDVLATMFVLLLRTGKILVRASPCSSGFATVLRRTLDIELCITVT